jgi:hypothetical protein
MKQFNEVLFKTRYENEKNKHLSHFCYMLKLNRSRNLANFQQPIYIKPES